MITLRKPGHEEQKKEKRWTNLAAAMLEEYQEEKIELINKGICGNILSPDSLQKNST